MNRLNPIDYLIYFGCYGIYNGVKWLYNKLNK